MTVNLTLNGEIRTFFGDPRTSLLDVLRETFRLTGTKPVCREGFCGACVVHIDGLAVPSCLRPIGLLQGASVTTIEGLAQVDALNALQLAFKDPDVVQCGMCFPGMVMTLSKFKENNPTPSRAEIKAAMIGNICRCTGYERIVDAVLSMQSRENAQ